MPVRLTSRWARGAPPWKLTGLWGGGEKFLCLSWVDLMTHHQLLLPRVRYFGLWEKLAERFAVRHFQEEILWAQFLHLLTSRKAVKSLTVMSAPCELQYIHEPSSSLLQIYIYMLDCMYSPITRITYMLIFPPFSLERFLRAIWNVFPGIQFSSCPKQNLIHHSYIVRPFSQWYLGF